MEASEEKVDEAGKPLMSTLMDTVAEMGRGMSM